MVRYGEIWRDTGEPWRCMGRYGELRRDIGRNGGKRGAVERSGHAARGHVDLHDELHVDRAVFKPLQRCDRPRAVAAIARPQRGLVRRRSVARKPGEKV